MEQSRVLVLLIIIVIIFFTPDGSPPSKARRLDDAIVHEKLQLALLRNTTFNNPGNLAGLLNEGPTPPGQIRTLWEETREAVLGDYIQLDHADGQSLDGISDHGLVAQASSFEEENNLHDAKLARRLDVHQTLPIYENATSSLFGAWEKLAIQDLPSNPTANITYEKNITGMTHGKISLSIEETTVRAAEHRVREVGVAMKLKDEKGGNEVHVALQGVHFVDGGELVLSTTSERFAGHFALPHFTMSEDAFSISRNLLNKSITAAITRQENLQDDIEPWLSTGEEILASTGKCEYIVYIQLHPVEAASIYRLDFKVDPEEQRRRIVSASRNGETAAILRSIEHELRFPTGIPQPTPPPIVATVLIYSPTCGVTLLAKDVTGLKVEQARSKAAMLGLGAAVVAALQLWLLIRQMNEASTPSTVSRISFWTLVMMGVVDGYLFFFFMTLALFINPCFLPLVTASFVYLTLLTMFEMRFLVTAYRVQRPERRSVTLANSTALPSTATPEPPIETPTNPSNAEVQSSTTIPPVTESADTSDSEEDIRQEISTLHTRFYFALLGTLFLTLHASSWPPLLRDIFVHILLVFVNSYWLPQIYRNAMRGSRRAFRWEFVFGTSLLRLTGVFYIYLYTGNIFHISTNAHAVLLIVGWVWVQCVALMVQEFFGPRFLLPKSWLPAVYDYHGDLPMDDDLEAAVPEAEGTTHSGSGRRNFDCAICMQSVDVPTRDERTAGFQRTSTDGRGQGIGLLGRRGYMVTPCRHVFHSNCLEGWMRFRLQCPICRNQLPPL